MMAENMIPEDDSIWANAQTGRLFHVHFVKGETVYGAQYEALQDHGMRVRLSLDDFRRNVGVHGLVCGLTDELVAAAKEAGETCSDCPPAGYPTDKTRCDECPRRAQGEADRG